MPSMLAMLNQSALKRARTSTGARLQVGSVAAMDRYDSRHTSLQSHLTEDLYLVAVHEEALWLVAILRGARDTGNHFQATQPNVTPVTAITAIAGELKFSTGSGIALEKMAMSLQTPRVLTPEDVALIEAFISPPSAQAVRQALGVVAGCLLGRPASAALEDEAAYAAFWQDEGFSEQFLARVDWLRLTLNAPDWATGAAASPLYGRADFDLSRSLVTELIDEGVWRRDSALEALVAAQGGWLYGAQLAELLEKKRLERAEVEPDPGRVFGRLISQDRSLYNVLRALFHIREPFVPVDDDNVAEVEPEWAKRLAEVGDERVRRQLGAFFLTAQTARAVGAHYAGSASPEPFDALKSRYEVVACWDIGEGQGEVVLARELHEERGAIPELKSEDLVVTYVDPPVLPPGARPTADGTTAELDALSMAEMIREEREQWPALEALQPLVEALERGEVLHEALERFIDAGGNWAMMRALGVNLWRTPEKRRRATAWLKALSPFFEPDDYTTRFEYAQALTALGCHAEALEVFEEMIAIGQRSKRKNADELVSQASNNAAWSCYQLEDYARGEALAKQALEAKRSNRPAQSTLAVLEIALGKEKAGFKRLEKTMRQGLDPEPNAALRAHPKFLELAARYRIPVVREPG